MFALFTAMAWGIGGYFEKEGLHRGNLSPVMGITIRTAVALVVLAVAGHAHWRTVPQAGTKALLYMAIGGGLIAGSVGMLCFYSALKGVALSKVMPIAFTAPLFGILMGVTVGGEALTVRTALGAAMALAGIVLLTTA